jgi:hypothetical protein
MTPLMLYEIILELRKHQTKLHSLYNAHWLKKLSETDPWGDSNNSLYFWAELEASSIDREEFDKTMGFLQTFGLDTSGWENNYGPRS